MQPPRRSDSGSVRKILLSTTISLLLVAVALFLWTRRRGEGPPGGEQAPEAATANPAVARSTDLAVLKPDAEARSEKAAGETPGEEPPVLPPSFLHGRVTGDGTGIEGASVIIFSTKGVEAFIDRMEDLASDPGVIPDIEPLVATVREELERFRSSGKSAKTDKDGKYEFRGIEPANYFVLALADGWLFHFGDVVALSVGREETLDFGLEHGASISGRVLNLAGEGIPQATVIAEFRPANMAGVGLIVRRLLRYLNGEFLKGPFQTTTKADGSFTVASLPPGVYDVAAYKVEGVEGRLSLVETGATDAMVFLGDPARLKARFTDAQGQPATGMPVLLERKDDQVQLPMPMAGFDKVANTVSRFVTGGPRKLKTGSKGELAAAALAPGKYKLLVEARGFLPLEREFELDWGQSLDLGVVQIDRGASIRGFVQAARGTPIEGARVMAVPANANFMNMGGVMNDFMTGRSSVWTDSKGQFRLKGLLRGTYKLSVTCSGYAPLLKRKVETDGEPLAIELKPGARITGRVLAAGDQSPIRDAKVRVSPVNTRTDGEGLFVLDGVTPKDSSTDPFNGQGPIDEAGAAGTTTIQVDVTAPGYLSQDEDLDLAKGETHVEFALLKAPEISGVVFDPDGKPAPGSLVRLTPSMPDDLPFDFFDTGMIFLSAAVSDLDGKFRFKDFRAGGKKSQYRVIADHVLYSRGASENFGLKEKAGGDPPVEVQVTLVRGGKVRGVVTDGVKPVPGATVRLAKAQKKNGQAEQFNMFLSMVGLPKGGDIAYADKAGKFEYDRVAPGDYVVSAEVAGFTDSPPQQISLAAGDEREVTLTVDPGGEVFGSVSDVNGTALPGARVRLFREAGAGAGQKGDEKQMLEAQKFFGGSYKSAHTGEDGAFRIQGLPAAKYTIGVDLQGFVKSEISGIAPNGGEQRIVLELAATLAGLVTDAASGLPIQHFRVVVEKSKPGEGSMEKDIPDAFKAREYSDVDGRFSRDDLESGPHVARVSAPGYSGAQKEVFLSPGVRVEERFALAQAGRIRGIVVDLQTQQPITGAKVKLSRSRPVAQAPENKEAQGVEDVSDRRRAREERSLAAREARKQGEPPVDDDAAMSQHFEEEWTPGESVVTSEDGTFLLEDVPPGPQRVKVSHASHITAYQDGVEASFGAEAELTIALRAGFWLKGKVRDGAGKPSPGRILFVHGVSAENANLSKSAFVDPEGGFYVGGLEKGTYHIQTPPQPGRKVTSEPVVVEVSGNTSDIDVTVVEVDGAP